MARVNDDRPLRLSDLPPPDSVEHVPPLHPATVRAVESLVRVAKNAVGIVETWLKERQR